MDFKASIYMTTLMFRFHVHLKKLKFSRVPGYYTYILFENIIIKYLRQTIV